MYSVWVNSGAVLVGGLIGTLMRGGIAERFRTAVTQGLALCVLLIGIMGAVQTQDAMNTIVSVALGCLLGEALKIEQRLDRAGDWAQRRFARGDSGFSEGFVSATLLFCVGAMAIVGSMEAGLSGNGATLLAKSALDGVFALIFASTMGPGVLLSIVPLTLYQGGIALLSRQVGALLSASVVQQMSAAGSVLIMGLGLNMLEAGKARIRVGNMLPAMFIPILYEPVVNWLSRLFG